MRRLDLARRDAGTRARRWDAVVVGGAVPGLVAAIRLGQRGHRVLVVEEEAAARLPAHLREPFFLGPPGAAGLVDPVLAEIKLALRDRRRLEPDALAYQVVLPDARVDVGDAAVTAGELVAWGLEKPEAARALVGWLTEAAQEQQRVLLEAPFVRRGGLRGLAPARASAPGAGAAALELPRGASRLATCLRAQTRALSNLAAAEPPPEARARLLGSALLGAAHVRAPELGLRRLLRRRLEELHGELRTVRNFELVSVDPHPGIAVPLSREVLLGRVLVLNAPLACLAEAQRDAEAPPSPLLDAAPRPARRAVWIDVRCDPQVLPEGMAARVIQVVEDADADEPAVVTLSRAPAANPHDAVPIAVRTVIDPARTSREDARRRMVDAVRSLVPFSSGRILEREHALPRWDDDDALCDPEGPATWPPEVDLRLAPRRPIFFLPRAEVACLGIEGEMLLGWRAGDAIAGEL
jgi:hypothetical protein